MDKKKVEYQAIGLLLISLVLALAFCVFVLWPSFVG